MQEPEKEAFVFRCSKGHPLAELSVGLVGVVTITCLKCKEKCTYPPIASDVPDPTDT